MVIVHPAQPLNNEPLILQDESAEHLMNERYKYAH
jgi:hypothetical protein